MNGKKAFIILAVTTAPGFLGAASAVAGGTTSISAMSAAGLWCRAA
jgi:hypothetical protein